VVRDIMELIESRTGLYCANQRLICGGRELDSDKTLDELQVKTKETLYLLERSQYLCPSWAATGTCNDCNCPLRESHTAANSPRYVEYMVNKGSRPSLPRVTLEAPPAPRRFALEIKSPGGQSAAASHTQDSEIPQISPVPTLVSEMFNCDWEPEATFAQKTVSTEKENRQSWPALAQTPGGISWESFTKCQVSLTTSRIEFNSSAEALLMNSDIPINTEILEQQASSWEDTEEVRAAAYSAWVADRAKKLRQPQAASVHQPLTMQATTA